MTRAVATRKIIPKNRKNGSTTMELLKPPTASGPNERSRYNEMPLKITPSIAKTALPALSFTPSMKSKSRIARAKSASSTSGNIRKKSWRNAAVSMRLALLHCVADRRRGRRNNHRGGSRLRRLFSFCRIGLGRSGCRHNRDRRLFAPALRRRGIVVARIHLLDDLPHGHVQNAEQRLRINADPEGQQHQRHQRRGFAHIQIRQVLVHRVLNWTEHDPLVKP